MKKIINSIKNAIDTYKNSLLTVQNKELTSTSKVFLFIFVIIIFAIIGKGVDMQQSYIVKPHQQFSYKCTNLIEMNKDIDAFQNRDVSQDIYSTNYRNKYWKLETFSYNHHRQSERNILQKFGRNELCQELGKKYLDVANSDTYKDKLILKEGLNNKITTLNNQVNQKTQEYSNTLLENIAKQESKFSILSTSSKTVKKELKDLRVKLSVLEKELALVEDIKTLEEFKAFKKFLDEKSQEILRLKDEANKYYRFKYTLNIFIFLLPVWFIFYMAYRTLKKREFFISSHLSLNVANVAALYMVFNFFLLIYTIIPKVFFSKLIFFLSQYNLTVLFNVAAILFFMLVFGILIQKIQKKDHKDNNSSKNKALFERRLRDSNTCVMCGNSHDKEDEFCGFCSHELKRECTECKEIIPNDYNYCPNCKASSN